MAKGEKTGGKNFKKGHAPMGGRPSLTEEQKEFKKLTTKQYINLLNKYLGLSFKELTELEKTKDKLTILEGYILNCFIVGTKKGDYKTLELMLNRLIGKPVQKIEFDGDITVENELSNKEFREIGKALLQAKGFVC